MKKVSGWFLRLLGWKINVDDKYRIDKAVVIMAPHTSMRDFWIGRLAFWYIQLPVKFLIKKEMFWFPMGVGLRLLGAVPVNRKRSGHVTEEIAQMFHEKTKFMFVITPEGTRNLNHHWKRGFYKIALMANVPVLLGYLDYARKEGGIGGMLVPTGNVEEDFKGIYDFYKNVTARYPEKFNLSPQHFNKVEK